MELKLVCLLLVLCASIGTIKGAFHSCCLDPAPYFHKRLLQRVEKYTLQKASGSCETEAVVLHVKKRKFCATPRVLERLKKLKIPKSTSKL